LLSNLVEAFPGDYETRVANADIEDFLATNAPNYDLILLGASTDRTAASRLFSPPTFERLQDVDADVAIVHRGR
jgi:spermidine synthase